LPIDHTCFKCINIEIPKERDNMNEPLLGHLVFKFAKSPENVATESLVFILNKSPIVKSAFIEFINAIIKVLPEDLIFFTRNADEEGTIPNIVGRDSNEREKLHVESKFWAGLTDNQPIGYLNRLSKQGGGLLVFVAPSLRKITLWDELCRICSNGPFKIAEVLGSDSNNPCLKIEDNIWMALTSWDRLLNYLKVKSDTSGLHEISADITQLSGLCEKMDTSAFLPLNRDELSPSFGRRVIQFCQIIDDVTNKLVSNNLVSLSGMRATPIYAGFIRYMKSVSGNIGYSLQFNSDYWSRFSETPLWLGIKSVGSDGAWEYSEKFREKLISLEFQKSYFIKVEVYDNLALVPLYMPFQSEREKVVASLFDQVSDIMSKLN
jgi:hypothetical protein